MGSPGDLAEERVRIHEIVAKLLAMMSRLGKCDNKGLKAWKEKRFCELLRKRQEMS